jgi:hypothetical protein
MKHPLSVIQIGLPGLLLMLIFQPLRSHSRPATLRTDVSLLLHGVPEEHHILLIFNGLLLDLISELFIHLLVLLPHFLVPHLMLKLFLGGGTVILYEAVAALARFRSTLHCGGSVAGWDKPRGRAASLIQMRAFHFVARLGFFEAFDILVVLHWLVRWSL